jgi:hypothetical protein
MAPEARGIATGHDAAEAEDASVGWTPMGGTVRHVATSATSRLS